MQGGGKIEGTFRRAWELLTHNWIIVVPALVVGVITGVILYILATYADISVSSLTDFSGSGVDFFTSFIGTVIAIVIRILGAIVSITYTTGMAGAAWKRGAATLADGTAALKRDAGQVFVAIVLLFLLGLTAAVFMQFTFYLTMLLYAIFVLYTMPAVIVGERPAVEGLIESFQIAWKNFRTTLVVVALILLIAGVGAVIAGFAHGIPFAGQVVELVLTEVVVAYATLVIVGEYLQLRPSLGSRPSAPPPPAAPAS
ncbi:MAG: hypothetical protein ACXWNK_00655 [Vulcanimicrobiaceae bacterium]